MTYYGLLEEAEKLLEKNKISYGEYVEMVEPLNEEIRKEGKWTIDGVLTVRCSNCKSQFHELEAMNFCPNCGAKMKGE